ncbi:hypothetical protein ACIP88_05245 [Streptomyces uncialis]|uniref:hypothetical protein n=1 Tax=Streptomyces uncialis TaxID=1048205 RepID=UPI0037FF0ED4
MTDDLRITARDVRRGDEFMLHGHRRTASADAWPVAQVHVHIPFVGGGDAVTRADKPLYVSRRALPRRIVERP